MMTKLYLVRHGETVANKAHILQGQIQGELNDEGIAQAQHLAEKMKGEPIDAFVASDLKRAIDTCHIIAQPHGKEVTTTPLLRERDWGSFTGKYIPDLNNQQWPDDVEPLDKLMQRADDFIQWVRRNYEGQTVLAVGHGIINKAIQSVFFHKPMKEIERMMNADVRILEL